MRHQPDPKNPGFCLICESAIEGDVRGCSAESAQEIVEHIFSLPAIQEAAEESVREYEREN